MEEFIGRMLHYHMKVQAYEKKRELPLIMQEAYEYRVTQMMGTRCLLVTPKEHINLVTIKKVNAYLKKATGLEVVFCFESLKAYTKDKMIENQIAFVINDEQLYVPFWGTYLKNSRVRGRAVEKILSLSQKFLLFAIYKGWNKINVSEAAHELGVSRMSMSRVFVDLENQDLRLIKVEGKSKYFVWKEETAALWDLVLPILRNPIKREYRLENPIRDKSLQYGGLTALSEYTMMTDNTYKTYAIKQTQVKELGLEDRQLVSRGEVPSEVMQVMLYEIPFDDGKCIDPLSTILSLGESDKREPRVEKATQELLEEVFSGKWSTEI